MQNKKPKLIFISHESSLTGAPILLLNFLQLLKKENLFEFLIVIKRGGPLNESFAAIARTVVLKPVGYQQQKSFLSKVLDYIQYRKKLYHLKKEIKSADLIFSNTITNGKLIKVISGSKLPIIVYVHELESAIQQFLQDARISLKLADIFLSPASIVTDNLVKNHNVKADTIFPLNYYFPNKSIFKSHAIREKVREDFLNKFQIPKCDFYVAGMGTANYRKGIDIFVDACKFIKQSGQKIHFVWIGDFTEADIKEYIHHIIRDFELEGTLTITGFVPYAPDTLLPFDLLALTSREDPYPLVVIEAALLQIPAIGFKGVGGIENFISNDAGFILDEASGATLAQMIIDLKDNTEQTSKRGDAALRKARELHSNPSLVLNQFKTAIEKLIKH